MGLASVKVCSQSGMFPTGLAKPDSNMAGTMNMKEYKMACCCVLAKLEMNSPMPIRANKNFLKSTPIGLGAPTGRVLCLRHGPAERPLKSKLGLVVIDDSSQVRATGSF